MNAQRGRTVGRGRKKEELVCSYRPLMCKDANYVDVEETSLASSHGFSGQGAGRMKVKGLTQLCPCIWINSPRSWPSAIQPRQEKNRCTGSIELPRYHAWLD